MNGHRRWNNVALPKCDTDSRILAALKEHEQVDAETIAERIGLTKTTICEHLSRLLCAGQVTRVRVKRHPLYSRGAAAHRPRREASIAFAGYSTHRGYANW